MKLILLRHGDAQLRSTTGKDFDRNLSPLGIQQAKWTAQKLLDVPLNAPPTIFCSAAKRTRETAHYALPQWEQQVQYFDDLYHASYEQLLSFLHAQSLSSEAAMLIGHNNGISDLASYLLDERIGLPTCGLVVIELPADTQFNTLWRGAGTKETWHFAPSE